ncbi:Gfo/Idh/MocA family oxidoreductase [Polynucleobacter sp. MWH-UH19D]|uniref:Gfo/Idh/MocA family protein n=1 Tax=Polynucleobacter sp. MWH-UH19D TaxID=1855610 RepID=UPI0033650D65
MNSQLLKVGIIGLGVGERHIAGYQQDERCNVVALCDFNKSKLLEVGGRYPGIDLYEDAKSVLRNPEIDVVSIATFDTFHYEQIMLAIQNDKHIFVEKPICLFQHELNEIKKALQSKPHIRLSSNLILRRESRFEELYRRIAAGDLGELYYFEGDYDYGRLLKLTDSWRGQIPFYSVTHGGGIHLIDLILWLSGQVPCEVFAFGNQISTKGSAFRYPDFVAALIKFESGLVAKVSANFGSVIPHGHKLCVYGTKGTFIHGHDGAFYYFSRDPLLPPEIVKDSYPSANKGDMIPSFIDYILTAKRPQVAEKEVFDAMSTSLAIERSLNEKCLVKVE